MPRGCFRYRSLMRSGAIFRAPFRCTRETLDVRYPFCRPWPRADRAVRALCRAAGAGLIMLEAGLGLVVALLVGAYLILTLIAPEKF
ncbi:potassium-transporting ATPase subunit F [Rhodobacter capsulatus]|uniref:Potassium-transporting ATPase subunit F n=1 Tax=Rhodobacter capsulatus TaxID=1061 RepID=A0A4U1JRF1_RHOCA|nr:potassium-transporting ATPase subunit F [Rhodobacter capsulatus]